MFLNFQLSHSTWESKVSILAQLDLRLQIPQNVKLAAII